MYSKGLVKKGKCLPCLSCLQRNPVLLVVTHSSCGELTLCIDFRKSFAINIIAPSNNPCARQDCTFIWDVRLGPPAIEFLLEEILWVSLYQGDVLERMLLLQGSMDYEYMCTIQCVGLV